MRREACRKCGRSAPRDVNRPVADHRCSQCHNLEQAAKNSAALEELSPDADAALQGDQGDDQGDDQGGAGGALPESAGGPTLPQWNHPSWPKKTP